METSRPSHDLPPSIAKMEGRDAAFPPATADVELMGRMKEGSEAAFAAFYDRFAPGLYSMIHAILKDQKESEDALQEAFVQMWKRRATYDPRRSSLFTWAVMISRHKAIDRLRDRQRHFRLASVVARETVSAIVTPSDRADQRLAQNDDRERVRAALSQIGEAQREAVDLAFFGGLTQMQISEKLGVPLGTVKARIRRGLLALRDRLGGAMHD